MKTKQAWRIDELPARVRRGKVLLVRRQVRQKKYDVDSRLTLVIEKVLEDLAS